MSVFCPVPRRLRAGAGVPGGDGRQRRGGLGCLQPGRVRCRQRPQRARQLGLGRRDLAARPDRGRDCGYHHDRPRRLVVHRSLPGHGGAGRRGHRAHAPDRDHAVHLSAGRLRAAPVGAGERPVGHTADGRGGEAGPARAGGHRRHERRRLEGSRPRQRALPVHGDRGTVRHLGHRPTHRPRLRAVRRRARRRVRRVDGLGRAA